MKYYSETIGRWWEYMYSLFGIAAIINIGLILLVAENPDGIVGVIRSALEERSSGTPLVVMLLALGPLFNAYVSNVAAKQAVEADDDFFHFNDEFELPVLPTVVERKRLIFALSVLTGLVFLPFAFWLYTATIEPLWGSDLPLFLQPGIGVSIVVVLAIYFLVPRLVPSAGRHLSQIENAVTKRLERGFDKDES